MTTTATLTATATLATTLPVDRFLAEMSSGAGISADLWTDDAVLDATVPMWRFDQIGAEAVARQFSGWYSLPITLDHVTRQATGDGEIVELDLSWVEDGVPFAAHQVHVLTIDGERISRDTVFCGGRWPADLLAEMEAARVR